MSIQQLCGHRYPGSTEKYLKVNHLEQVELINNYFPAI